jgi:hypothetical protein
MIKTRMTKSAKYAACVTDVEVHTEFYAENLKGKRKGKAKGKVIPVTGRRDCRIYWTIGSQMALRLSALRVGRLLRPGRFLVLIYLSGSVDPRIIVRLEGLDQLKNSNDLIGNLNRELPAYSILPQPTTLPRASHTGCSRID